MTLSLLDLVRLLARFRRGHAPPAPVEPPAGRATVLGRGVVLAVALADDDPATARGVALTLLDGWRCPCADCRRLRRDVVRALWRRAEESDRRARAAAEGGGV